MHHFSGCEMRYYTVQTDYFVRLCRCLRTGPANPAMGADARTIRTRQNRYGLGKGITGIEKKRIVKAVTT